MYHAFFSTNGHGRYAVLWRDLDEQLKWLKANGYEGIGFRQIEDRVLNSLRSLKKSVAISIDDGHRSNLAAAEKIAESGAWSIVFITPEFCEKRTDFLNRNEIKALSKIADIGSHGLSHKNLTLLSEKELERELTESRQYLEDLIGKEVPYLAAPGGSINTRVIRKAQRSGYRLIGTSREWWNDAEQTSKSRLVNRVAIRDGWSLDRLGSIVTRSPSFYAFRRLRSVMLKVPKVLIQLK